MDDAGIIELYWQRDELAIAETDSKYGKYCRYVSDNILRNPSDSEECVNDCYLKVWNAIPSQRPNNLTAFLGKIVRNLSLSRLRARSAAKRGGGQYELCLEELSCLESEAGNAERELELRELSAGISRFLSALPPLERDIFLSRYWYMAPVDEIAKRAGFSYSKTASILYRSRNKLKNYLDREGLL